MLLFRTAEEIPCGATVSVAPVFDPAFAEAYFDPRAKEGASGAFPCHADLTFTLLALRGLCTEAAVLSVYCDDTGETLEFPFIHADQGFEYDRFTLSLPASALVTKGASSALCYYTVMLSTVYGTVYVTAPSPEKEGEQILSSHADGLHRFQLTIYAPPKSLPRPIIGGVIYHVFVDRFCKGGEVPCKADAVLNPDWEHGIPQFASVPGGYVENNEFFGGTLWGVAKKLDYFAALGVSCLYLSPVFEAHSNHKYDTADYETVDAMFGGDEALRFLCREAKKRGIAVVLDGVFNHTGSDSRYFDRLSRYEDVGAYESPDSPYASWYTFRKYPDRYRCWWDIPILPAVKSDEPSYLSYICGENGIAAKWMRAGIGGFRLDVADELSDVFLEALAKRVKEEDPEAILFGEVWEDASNKIAYDKRRRYFRGGQLDGVMNYPLRTAILAFLREGDSRFLSDTAELLWHHYPRHVSACLMNLLGTHDTERILNMLSDLSPEGKSNKALSTLRLSDTERAVARERLLPAYLLLCFLPGDPCIYYGDEAGAEGWHDPFNRAPFPWGREDRTILAWYRKLGQIRRAFPSLGGADFTVIEREGGVFGFRRSFSEGEILCIVNRSEAVYPVSLAGRWEDLLSDDAARLPALTVVPKKGFLLAYKEGASPASDPQPKGIKK